MLQGVKLGEKSPLLHNNGLLMSEMSANVYRTLSVKGYLPYRCWNLPR